jgi:hypothetical protein
MPATCADNGVAGAGIGIDVQPRTSPSQPPTATPPARAARPASFTHAAQPLKDMHLTHLDRFLSLFLEVKPSADS